VVAVASFFSTDFSAGFSAVAGADCFVEVVAEVAAGFSCGELCLAVQMPKLITARMPRARIFIPMISSFGNPGCSQFGPHLGWGYHPALYVTESIPKRLHRRNYPRLCFLMVFRF